MYLQTLRTTSIKRLGNNTNPSSTRMNLNAQNCWDTAGRSLNRSLLNALRIDQYVLEKEWELLANAMGL